MAGQTPAKPKTANKAGTPQKPEGGMTEAHKKALAEGRNQGRIVTQYLHALEVNKPKRGRQVTPESLRQRLAKVNAAIVTAPPVERLSLVQQRIDIEETLDRLQSKEDITELQQEFVRIAKAYSEKRKITYTAWREIGVPADVLRAAGIDRKAA